ncbi:GntR family transcriptional regulator [Brachybacterium alimentarium]|uniref:GntR family transcriptional regulator n=1 Tax=Brachybacterium alimentarium TaxID=47845 RepID=UPI003FD0C4E4
MPRPAHTGDPGLRIRGRGPRATESKGAWVHAQLAELAARMPPGSLFPSDRVISEELGVARMTVRGQVDVLAEQGLLERKPHRGTFVRRPGAVIGHQLQSFSSEMRARGMEPSSRILSFEVLDATPAGAPRHDVSGEVIHVRRVRSADGNVMALEDVQLPRSRYPRLTEEMLEGRSLYDVLATEFGVVAESAEQTITLAWPVPEELEQLQLPSGSAALCVERSTHDTMGRLVERGRSLYRADRYQVQMHVGVAAQYA